MKHLNTGARFQSDRRSLWTIGECANRPEAAAATRQEARCRSSASGCGQMAAFFAGRSAACRATVIARTPSGLRASVVVELRKRVPKRPKMGGRIAGLSCPTASVPELSEAGTSAVWAFPVQVDQGGYSGEDERHSGIKVNGIPGCPERRSRSEATLAY